MKNNKDLIFGTKAERLAIPLSTVLVGQVYCETDTNLGYRYNGVDWVGEDATNAGLPLRHFLTDNFDGSGVFNMVGNYSVTAKNFGYTNTHSSYALYSVLFAATDNATFNSTDFAGITGGLTNGITMWYKPVGGTPIPFIFDVPVRKNYEWYQNISETNLTNLAGSTQTLVMDLQIVAEYGMPVVLQQDDQIYITIHDDLSSMISFTCGIRGVSQN